jgi:hypothetical protein
MPNYIHPTISTVIPSTRGKGSSSTADLMSMFPGSPGVADYLGPAGAAAYKKEALDLLLQGEVTTNLQTGAADRDFGKNATDDRRKPPSYGDGAIPASGPAPASAWVPNTTSPGPGSVDPNDQPAPPTGYGTVPTNSIANVGGSTDVTQPGRNPAISSTRMSHGSEEAEYVAGQSPATANAS